MWSRGRFRFQERGVVCSPQTPTEAKWIISLPGKPRWRDTRLRLSQPFASPYPGARSGDALRTSSLGYRGAGIWGVVGTEPGTRRRLSHLSILSCERHACQRVTLISIIRVCQVALKTTFHWRKAFSPCWALQGVAPRERGNYFDTPQQTSRCTLRRDI